MKAMDIFCASQASTAVALPTADQPSPTPLQPAAGRAIDRHNPIIADARRITCGSFPNPPCSSQYSPINPRPYHQLHTAGDSAGPKKKTNAKRSSSVIRSDIVSSKWRCAKGSDMATLGSTRFLLDDKSFGDASLDLDPLQTTNNNEITPTTHTFSSSQCKTSPVPSDQVVVLRVSLHCRGCEGKLRKHLSRMEGVSSFNIDFAAKKVTIRGSITPQGVLESVAKVKNAQFWPSSDPIPPSSIQNPDLNQQLNVRKKP